MPVEVWKKVLQDEPYQHGEILGEVRVVFFVLCRVGSTAAAGCPLLHRARTPQPPSILKLTETPGSLTRTFFSDAHKSAARRVRVFVVVVFQAVLFWGHAPHTQTKKPKKTKKTKKQIVKWMEDAGMDAWRDVMGNVHGVLNGSDLDAPAVLLGSHYDTVVDAGKWDGALGVLLAIAATKGLVVEALHRLSSTSVS